MSEINSEKKQHVIHRHRFLMRGESMVASTGLAVAAILLAGMGISAWWISRTYHQTYASAQETEMLAIGDLLADTSRSLLEAGEVTALRRVIAEASRKYELEVCRIILPDGQSIADGTPSNIALLTLPETWPGSVSGEGMEPIGPDGLFKSNYALNIPGRGWVRLEMVMSRSEMPNGYWELQAGGGIVGAISLIALLGVYRRMRSRLSAMGAIRDALLAYEGGMTSESSLLLSTEFGKEAVAWNQLLKKKQDMNKQLIEEKVAQSTGSPRDNHNVLHGACDAMKQGLILVDTKMRTRYLNGAAAILLQTTREATEEAELSSYLKNEQILEMVESVINGKMRRWTTHEISIGEGVHTGVLRFSVRPVRQNDTASAMIVIEDITQQRVAEDARKSFVIQATHELRTPLTNIRLYAETAVDEGENDPVVRAKCLNIINQESRRLERIVGDMLSVSEIEAGTMQIRKGDVRLDTLFEQLEGDYQAMAQEKQITLSFDLPPKLPVLQGDRDKLVLAMHNLLGNALKYTPDKGKVNVRVEVDETHLHFEVSDSGIGIDENEIELIFDKFYRAKNSREGQEPGSGLGLSLAREVVRMHGGDITVHTELNKGSRFTMTLPVMAKAA